MQRRVALQALLLAVLLAEPRSSKGRLLSGSKCATSFSSWGYPGHPAMLEVRSLPGVTKGQLVCWGGTRRPCYKVMYFPDAFQRLNFEEAQEACRRDRGELVSIETEDEQRLIEKFIENLLASDGDFWIGLRRLEEKQSNNTACQDLYTWTDGSTSQFRNWYVDEPSCGSEVCVVMYHQPSAPPGIGGSYMFQWNDDRCNMKNNFICKYSDGNKSFPSYMDKLPTSSPISKTADGTKNLFCVHGESPLQMPATLNSENSCKWKCDDSSSLRNGSSKGEAIRCKRRGEKGKDLIYS